MAKELQRVKASTIRKILAGDAQALLRGSGGVGKLAWHITPQGYDFWLEEYFKLDSGKPLSPDAIEILTVWLATAPRILPPHRLPAWVTAWPPTPGKPFRAVDALTFGGNWHVHDSARIGQPNEYSFWWQYECNPLGTTDPYPAWAEHYFEYRNGEWVEHRVAK